jgi:hypothetical protein
MGGFIIAGFGLFLVIMALVKSIRTIKEISRRESGGGTFPPPDS